MPKPLSRTKPQLPPPAQRMSDRQALNETFAKAHGEVELLRHQGAVVAYKLGERLCTIRDLQLFKEGGFRTFDDYLEALKGASVRTYYRCIARYSAVTAELARQVDPERIDLAAKLLPHGKGKEPTINDRSLAALQVAVEREGRRVSVKFAEATTTELREAARKRGARPAPSEVVRHGLVRLGRLFGTGVGAVAGVRYGRQGKATGVTIFVPEDRLAAFEKLLKG